MNDNVLHAIFTRRRKALKGYVERYDALIAVIIFFNILNEKAKLKFLSAFTSPTTS